jgi:pimeloyl-ACP methyl ester carboxylesterase
MARRVAVFVGSLRTASWNRKVARELIALAPPLLQIDMPTLIMHGDGDQIVPIGALTMLSSKLVKGPTLKVYPGFDYGMCATHKDEINADLLAFIQG